MGYDRHHAIVVTTFQEGFASVAHARAVQLGLQVSEILVSGVNFWSTFLVAPDGSKEGWTTSYEGDFARKAFTDWLNEQQKQSKYSDWVEVQYGDDDLVTKVVDSSDDESLRNPEV